MHHSGMLRVIKHHLPSHPGAPWMHSCGNKSQLQSLHTCSAWSSVNTPGRSAELQCGGHNKSAGPSLACDSPAPVIAVSPVRQNKSIGPSDQMGTFLRAQSLHTASVTGFESVVRNHHKTGRFGRSESVCTPAALSQTLGHGRQDSTAASLHLIYQTFIPERCDRNNNSLTGPYEN